jgi:hypothetical protein
VADKIKVFAPTPGGELVETIGENMDVIEALFNYLYNEWIEEIKYQSSIDSIINNDYYKKILSMGWKVVPYIIDALKAKPNHLFLALSEITGENPVKPEHYGKIKDITRDWIEWWNEKSHVVE